MFFIYIFSWISVYGSRWKHTVKTVVSFINAFRLASVAQLSQDRHENCLLLDNYLLLRIEGIRCGKCGSTLSTKELPDSISVQITRLASSAALAAGNRMA
jgi:hypothetical protein